MKTAERQDKTHGSIHQTVVQEQLKQLAQIQKILMKILDKGGVEVVVGDDGSLITAYNYGSNKYVH